MIELSETLGVHFNPRVTGSIPAGPTTKCLQLGDSFGATFEVDFRLFTRPSTPEEARTSASERETHSAS
jgi:hypothetical protein